MTDFTARRPQAALAGAGLVLAGFWHPAAVFVPMGLVGFAQGLCLPNIMASAVALAPRTPGSAASMLGFSQQLVGAAAVQGLARGAPAPTPASAPVPEKRDARKPAAEREKSGEKGPAKSKSGKPDPTEYVR